MDPPRCQAESLEGAKKLEHGLEGNSGAVWEGPKPSMLSQTGNSDHSGEGMVTDSIHVLAGHKESRAEGSGSVPSWEPDPTCCNQEFPRLQLKKGAAPQRKVPSAAHT